MPYTILNKNGNALRNLNSGAWNKEGKYASKPVVPWTFADKNVDEAGNPIATLKKALDLLASKGFEGLTVFKLIDSERPAKPIKPVKEKVPVQKVEDIESEEDEDPYILFKTINPKCMGCVKECKQPHCSTPIRCDYEKKKEAA